MFFHYLAEYKSNKKLNNKFQNKKGSKIITVNKEAI